MICCDLSYMLGLQRAGGNDMATERARERERKRKRERERERES